MKLPESLQKQLDLVRMARQAGLATFGLEVSSGCGPTMVVEGRECINFISNSYMGFSIHPKVIEAARKAAKEFGIGIGGSPMACGTTVLHNRLCEKIAEVYNKPAAMVFASGYQALAGVLQGLLGPKDTALLDNLDHRSIIDGCRLAGCRIRTFVHNDMADLERLVEATRESDGQRMVVVDSVYSMDGDLAPLPELSRICRNAGVWLCIDEAHALGVIGPNGGGLPDHFGMPDGADVVAGTFSKFAGAVGGFCAAEKDVIDLLKIRASPYVFSASLPPPIVAAVTASFELLETEPEWRERLHENVRFFIEGLRLLGFDTGNSTTPVIPVMIRDTEKTLRMNAALLELGIFASAVVHPAVPPRKERLRLGLMATHTREHLERALDAFERAGKQAGVIQ